MRFFAFALLLLVSPAYAQDFTQLQQKAEQGDEKAQIQLGFHYEKGFEENGQRVQNYQTALAWYRRAVAAHGSLWAQNRIALMYEHGRGVVQDYLAAYQLYYAIAQSSDALMVNEADAALVRMERKMTPDQWEQAKAWREAQK